MRFKVKFDSKADPGTTALEGAGNLVETCWKFRMRGPGGTDGVPNRRISR